MAAAQETGDAAAGRPGTATAAQEEELPRETRKLFVGGVPSAAQEADLLAHFARFGEVRSVVLMRDRETGHGRGFGFVEFVDEGAAAGALAEPQHCIFGRQVNSFFFLESPLPSRSARSLVDRVLVLARCPCPVKDIPVAFICVGFW
jgi:RNA recognition motif-containing protein